MSKICRLGFGLVLLAAAFGPAAVGNAEAQQPIKIGYLSSLSGPFTPWGILVRDGMKLAVAEVNSAGGVAGRPVELVERDDRNNPSEAVTAFQYMVERENVVAVGGIISSDVGLAVSREAESRKVPLFLTMSGSDAILTKESRYTFRTCLPAAPMNMGYIAGLIQEKKYTRVGAIVADYAWGRAINDAIDTSVKPLPGVKLQVEIAPVSERDFTPYLRKLQDLNPELLIATGHPPGSVTIARQAIELGIGGQIVGPWYPTEFTPERGGELIFGHFVDYTCADFDSPDYQRLAAKFHSASNHLLDINGISGYAIVKILVQTIAETKSTDPKVLPDAVRAGRFVIPGYGWPLSYTEWGEMKEAAPLLYTYEKGSAPDGVNPGGELAHKGRIPIEAYPAVFAREIGMSPSQEPVLEVQALTKRFGGSTALSDVSFSAEAGEIVGLIGPNGAGKTTLLNVLSGVVKPTSGKVFFAGRDLSGLKTNAIARLGIARTLQTPRSFPRMTVLENVLVGALFRAPRGPRRMPHSDTAVARHAESMLDLVGLRNRGGSPMSSLNLQERKMVEIARALAMSPALVLIDEAMSGLNPTEIENSMRLIRRVREQTGVTIIWVEHVVKAIMQVVERVIVLNFGEVIATGTPSEIVRNEAVIQAYLGYEA